MGSDLVWVIIWSCCSVFNLSRLTLVRVFNTKSHLDFSSAAVSEVSAAALHLQLLNYTALIPSVLHNVALIFVGKLIYLDLQFSMLERDKRVFELKTKAQMAI